MTVDVHAHYFPKAYNDLLRRRQTFHYIREAGLPAEDVDKILHETAQILLGLEAAPMAPRAQRV